MNRSTTKVGGMITMNDADLLHDATHAVTDIVQQCTKAVHGLLTPSQQGAIRQDVIEVLAEARCPRQLIEFLADLAMKWVRQLRGNCKSVTAEAVSRALEQART
jgi:hypothetical protein